MTAELTVVHAPGLPTRSTRIVWLLEELGLPYKVHCVYQQSPIKAAEEICSECTHFEDSELL